MHANKGSKVLTLKVDDGNTSNMDAFRSQRAFVFKLLENNSRQSDVVKIFEKVEAEEKPEGGGWQ